MTKPATFNDGKIATRHKVSVEIQDALIRIVDPDGGLRASWRLEDIRLVGSIKDRPVRLRCSGSDARLTLDADDDGNWLTRRCLSLKKHDAGALRWPTWVAAGIFAAASILGIFIYLLPSMASAIVKLIPASLEQSIGEQSRTQLLELLGQLRKDQREKLVCTEPRAYGILNKRAKELATLMDSPFPVHVTVVRYPVANALTLPGGEIVILSGLLDKAESGDAVIGVLAHEMAHVVRRDPLQVSIKQTGSALLLSLVVGDVFGGTALSGITSGLIESGYSRDAEAAADFLAVTALNQLGWSALPLANFIAGMDKESPMAGIIPSFLNSHPSGDSRQRDIIALSQGVERSMSQYEWKTLKSMCQ